MKYADLHALSFRSDDGPHAACTRPGCVWVGPSTNGLIGLHGVALDSWRPCPGSGQRPRRNRTMIARIASLITVAGLALGLAACVALSGCTPAQTAAARRGATVAAIDLGLCAARGGASGQELQRWGSILASDNWRVEVTDMAIGCVLHALAAGLSQDSRDASSSLVRIQRRIDCEGPGCDIARQRAAILLLEAVSAGKVKLPPDAPQLPRSGTN